MHCEANLIKLWNLKIDREWSARIAEPFFTLFSSLKQLLESFVFVIFWDYFADCLQSSILATLRLKSFNKSLELLKHYHVL